MAKRKREETGKVTASPKKTHNKVTAADEPVSDYVIETPPVSVHVSRSFTIPGSGEYESLKVGIGVTMPTYEEASALLDQYMIAEVEKAREQFAELAGHAEETEKQLEEGGEEEAEAEEEEEEEAKEIDVETATREEMIAYIDENEIDIDPKEHKGRAGTKTLRAALTEAIEGTKEAGEEEEEEEEEDAAEEEDVTEEGIRAMKRSELIEFIKQKEIDIDPDDYKKLVKLQDAVVEAALSEEENRK